MAEHFEFELDFTTLNNINKPACGYASKFGYRQLRTSNLELGTRSSPVFRYLLILPSF
jgi:hypothetical protein